MANDDKETPVIDFAEASEWEKLMDYLDERPEGAKEVDDFGMTPLHWSCTDNSVPIEVIEELLDLFADATKVANAGGFLPLHIAIKAKATLEVIKLLVKENPAGLVKKTDTGNALEIAKTEKLQKSAMDYLKREAKRFCQHIVAKRAKQTQMMKSAQDKSRAKGVKGLLLSSSSGWKKGAAKRRRPPKFKQDLRCSMCRAKFNGENVRHHCRACGNSVCASHSGRTADLSHLSLPGQHRVCLDCDHELNGEEEDEEDEDMLSDEEEGKETPSAPTMTVMEKQISALQEKVQKKLTKRRSIQAEIELRKSEVQAIKLLKEETEDRIEKLECLERQQADVKKLLSEDLYAIDECKIVHNIGKAMIDKGDFQSAVSQLKHALSLKASDPTIWVSLGLAYHSLEDFHQAEHALKTALEYNPNVERARSLLGKVLHANGKHEEAIEVYRKALSAVSGYGEDAKEGIETVDSSTANL